MGKLAVNGGPKLREKAFPTWPMWDEADVQAAADVVRSGQWWSVGGTKVKEFERAFAQYVGCEHAICVPNGTLALVVAMKAAGIGCGDEVIVTPYTFIASASSILQANAVPVFVDIDPETLNIDPKQIEAAVTDKTRAIMAVHIAGLPVDVDAIGEVAKRHNLLVVEDCAQAHGSEWNGRRVGALGDVGAFSFQASKNLTCGEGGIVTTARGDIGEMAWSIHNVGRVKGGRWYEHPVMGSNYRMTEFQAAVLLTQMRKLEDETRRRNENALYLSRRLSEIEGVEPLARDPRVTCHAYHLYIFRYLAGGTTGVDRAKFLSALNAEGIPCSSGYVPLYREGLFAVDEQSCPVGCSFYGKKVDYSQVNLPNAERACTAEAVWLFQSMLLGDRSDMDDIAAAVGKVMDNIEELR